MLKWFRREAAKNGTGVERGRRDFFKYAGAGAVAGGAALLTDADRASAAELQPGADGYRETDHVRRYYDSARM